MPIVNNLTTNFSWPLPNQANFLSDDVARLITTIQSIDTTLYAIQVTHNNTPVTLASASTVNIGAAASDNVIISGTTTITAFDNVNNGVKRWVRFSGALTLTHNGTSLILPGAANITTAANDTAEFISLGGGNWQCIRYTKASVAPYSGTVPVIPSGVLKGSGGAIAAAVAGTDYVTPTGSETLTNKTLTGYKETVYTLATSGSINLNPANGSVQSCTAAGVITFVDALSAGQSIVLMLANGSSYTITWPTVTWVSSSGNVAPTLSAGNTVVFWKVGSTLYAAHVGKYA